MMSWLNAPRVGDHALAQNLAAMIAHISRGARDAGGSGGSPGHISDRVFLLLRFPRRSRRGRNGADARRPRARQARDAARPSSRRAPMGCGWLRRVVPGGAASATDMVSRRVHRHDVSPATTGGQGNRVAPLIPGWPEATPALVHARHYSHISAESRTSQPSRGRREQTCIMATPLSKAKPRR